MTPKELLELAEAPRDRHYKWSIEEGLMEVPADYIFAVSPDKLIPILKAAMKMAEALSCIIAHTSHDEVRIYDPVPFRDALAEWEKLNK